ncbi:MAG: hypothetical protein Q8O62_09945 [Aequorivita sp.]|nr:hypothetical protein [Aequorivita sp.]
METKMCGNFFVKTGTGRHGKVLQGIATIKQFRLLYGTLRQERTGNKKTRLQRWAVQPGF